MSKIIELKDVAMRFDRRTVLSDVNLTVDRGDFLAITGPNGGGKTTLLRIILKLLRPTEGTVNYYVDGRRYDELAIGYLPQKNMIDSRFPITVREVVSLGLTKQLLPQADTLIAKTLRLVGLEEKADASLGSLSGGQLQRALMGRAIISKPRLLVLDEPLSYVDKRFESRIYDIVHELAPSTTIILVSHDMSRIASMANRHIIVDRTLEFCHSRNHFLHYSCCDHDHGGKTAD